VAHELYYHQRKCTSIPRSVVRVGTVIFTSCLLVTSRGYIKSTYPCRFGSFLVDGAKDLTIRSVRNCFIVNKVTHVTFAFAPPPPPKSRDRFLIFGNLLRACFWIFGNSFWILTPPLGHTCNFIDDETVPNQSCTPIYYKAGVARISCRRRSS
jgi:hypothetical protein